MKKLLLVLAAAVPLVVVGSLAVWQLSAKDNRRIGALGSLKEPLALSWLGEWSAEMRYAPGQVVSYAGSSYVAESEVASDVSPDPRECKADCPWALMAAKGLQGASGSQGPAGAQGASGISGYELRKVTISLDPNFIGIKTASCPAGKKVFGGMTKDGSSAIEVGNEYPVGPAENNGNYGWRTTVMSSTPGTFNLEVLVVCADAS